MQPIRYSRNKFLIIVKIGREISPLYRILFFESHIYKEETMFKKVIGIGLSAILLTATILPGTNANAEEPSVSPPSYESLHTPFQH